MGLFCVNFHFKTANDAALRAALERRGVESHRVLPVENGWVSLYEEEASNQDEGRIRELGSNLSQDLKAPAIAFLVHDSDIACYWLFDKGELLDEYNSCPDYFDDDDHPREEATPAGGLPEVLVRYCSRGTTVDALAAILNKKDLFAERIIENLAEALGISVERALADFRNAAEGDLDGDFDGDDDDDGPRGGGGLASRRTDMAGLMAQMMGGGQPRGPVDPKAAALVQAAASGNLDELNRLLADGVDIHAEAPAPLPRLQSMAGLAQMLPGGVPQFPMTALNAAVSHKQRGAVERLLAAGADPNRAHPMFGTAIHAAAGAGDAEMLQLLLDRGGDPRVLNPQGQTPLGAIKASRASMERIKQMQEMVKTMGMAIPGMSERLAAFAPPDEGWTACEKLLVDRGGK
ncbi:MAG TPA: ankyrin repeat domain-containing protein [Gemmata sp.]|nr:ankyrin repeat domain-containing protein [Gemmata sp.]